LNRRTLVAVVGLCVVAGTLTVAAPAAHAARPFGVQQFHPNDTNEASTANCGITAPPGCTGDVLSDKFDGVDSAAHLTAVATPDTDNVTWYACPLGSTIVNNGDLATCSVVIGTDSTGLLPPVGPAASSPADEAYDVTWDIPGSLDNQRRDIVALACTGSGQNLDNPNPNCRVSEENSIFLEDAQTGVAQNQTTSAEFGSYRTNPNCLFQPPSDTVCEGKYKFFPHGSPVPNDGFDFQAFSSDDVQQLAYAINAPADAQTEPDETTLFALAGCNVVQTFTNFKRWRCDVPGSQVPDDSEMSIALINANGGGALPEGNGGYCNSENNPASAPSAQNTVQGAHDDCVLDAHYAVSSARQAARLFQSFGANPPSPSATAGCPADGRTPDTDESSQLGTAEDVIICIEDQFTDPFGAPWTEETTGVGRIQDCGPYTAHDHNGDGVIDDCHGQTGGPSGSSANLTVDNPTGPTGDQILTSCYDPQNQATNPVPANHGCADAPAALKATLTVHWSTAASEVFLAFNNPAPNNAADPCRTGTTFKRNNEGDHDDITVCTFDSNGNPVPTDTSSRRLQWTITGAQGEESTAVRFNPAPPPDETTGSGASATAGIDAVQEGDNFINVFLLDANGDVVDTFSLEKQVHGETPPRNIRTNLTAKKGRKFIRGKANSAQTECQADRSVTLLRRRKGPDDVMGTDTTNAFGRWGVRTGRHRGTYYARVAAFTTIDTQTGGQLNCLADQSKDVHRG
jgi:hypothetical protein